MLKSDAHSQKPEPYVQRQEATPGHFIPAGHDAS